MPRIAIAAHARWGSQQMTDKRGSNDGKTTRDVVIVWMMRTTVAVRTTRVVVVGGKGGIIALPSAGDNESHSQRDNEILSRAH